MPAGCGTGRAARASPAPSTWSRVRERSARTRASPICPSRAQRRLGYPATGASARRYPHFERRAVLAAQSVSVAGTDPVQQGAVLVGKRVQPRFMEPGEHVIDAPFFIGLDLLLPHQPVRAAL